MKKVHLALIPLMAISFLTNCGSGNKSLQDCTWQEIQEISKSGQAQNRFKVGDEKIVQVGGVDHKVRIIGFNHDYSLTRQNYVGITFEFANMISDSSGLSLAVFWNDFYGKDQEESSYTTCLNYFDSSVRAALVGKKGHDENTSEANPPKWFRYYGEGSPANAEFIVPSDPYYGKSVFDLLPDDLKSVIEPVAKSILTCTNLDDGTPRFKDDYVIDPLFLLTSREMASDLPLQESGTYPYAYYSGHTAEDDQIRVKKQVDNRYGHIGHKAVKVGGYVADTDEHGDSAKNFAGCFYMKGGEDSTGYWTRSVSKDATKPCAYALRQETGHIKDYNARQNAFGVAPAFCI